MALAMNAFLPAEVSTPRTSALAMPMRSMGLVTCTRNHTPNTQRRNGKCTMKNIDIRNAEGLNDSSDEILCLGRSVNRDEEICQRQVEAHLSGVDKHNKQRSNVNAEYSSEHKSRC